METLSDNAEKTQDTGASNVYREEAVKSFIEQLKAFVEKKDNEALCMSCCSTMWIREEIDKLAGDKLT